MDSEKRGQKGQINTSSGYIYVCMLERDAQEFSEIR